MDLLRRACYQLICYGIAAICGSALGKYITGKKSLEDHRKEVMYAASPNAPVMAAREGLASDLKILGLKESIVLRKAVKVIVLGTHCSVKYAVAVGKFLFVVENIEMGLMLAVTPGSTHESAEDAYISKFVGI